MFVFVECVSYNLLWIMLRKNLNKAYLIRSNVFVLKNQAWALVAINLIPTLGRQKQADLNEFKVSLVHRASSRTGSIAAQTPWLTTHNG